MRPPTRRLRHGRPADRPALGEPGLLNTAGRTAQPATWVIGAGGLLGTALTSALRSRGATPLANTPVGWTTDRAGGDLSALLTRFVDSVRRSGLSWRIAWCAGAGVTGTAENVLTEEVRTLSRFLDAVAAQRLSAPGRVFLASSAGALYAGNERGGPYDERDELRPISAYGWAKLACEDAGARFADATGHQVVIGRIANLYGPNQDLTKAQGLISHLCRGFLTRQPTSIFVPLDTIRDYLYVDDCAAMIADMLLAGPAAPGAPVVRKVLASQQGTTIGSLLALCRHVFKRPPQLVLGSSATARFQVRDLRLRSVEWTEIDRRVLTPLPAGLAATAAGMLRAAQRGRW